MKTRHIIAGCMRWGTWGAQWNTAAFRNTIEQCLEAGIHRFDHADIYGDYTTEADFGKALAEIRHRRQELQLITKCGIKRVSSQAPQHLIKHYDTSAAHIIASAEQSLKNLQTDYLDVLLIHRPDPLMDAAEIASAFDQLKSSGKVLAFGVSNFHAHQVSLLRSWCKIDYNQMEISAVTTDAMLNGNLDYCQQHGIIPMAWAPLGAGKLFLDHADEKSRRIIGVAGLLAEKYHASIPQILINWLWQHPAGIEPVVGTTHTERMKDLVKAKQFDITREEWFMIWRAAAGQEVP